MCPVDTELGSIFIHPRLQSLTISCVRIGSEDLDHLKIYAQRTPLRCLFLDQCDISAAGLATILSLPMALKGLEVLEVSQQGPRKHELEYSQPLFRALSLQRTSLESLALSLRDPRQSPFSQDFNMSSFHALRVLNISCKRHGDSVYPTSLKWVTYTPPALDMLIFSEVELQHRQNNVNLPSELQTCLKALDPVDLSYLARTVCLSLQSGSDVRADARKTIEEVGQRFRKASSQTAQATSSATPGHHDERKDSPRLFVTRFTRARGAIPPYLYREYRPEAIPLYDSSSKGTGWLSATDRRHGSPYFPHLSPHLSFDFSALEESDALNDFDFDSFLNGTTPDDTQTVFGDPFVHHHPVGDALPTWLDTADINAYYITHTTHFHDLTHDETNSDSVD